MLRFTDPFEDVNRMLSSFGGVGVGGSCLSTPMRKTVSTHCVLTSPELTRRRVDVTVEGSILTVTAESPMDEDETVTWLLRERPAGSHQREVRLGERLDPAAVDANLDNGVLTVTIPMREEAKPHKVAVSSGTSGEIGAGSSN
jgi:HSP20 family protein